MDEIRKSKVLSQINILSSYMTLGSVISLVVIGVIQIHQKNNCWRPDYPQSELEVPMVIVANIVLIFVLLMIISGFFRVVLRTEKWKPPMNLNSWKMILISIALLVLYEVYFFLYAGSPIICWI